MWKEATGMLRRLQQQDLRQATDLVPRRLLRQIANPAFARHDTAGPAIALTPSARRVSSCRSTAALVIRIFPSANPG